MWCVVPEPMACTRDGLSAGSSVKPFLHGKSPEMEPQPCQTAAERLRELRRNLQSARDEINRFAALSARKRRRGRPSTLPKRAKDIACIIHDIEYPSWKTAEEYLLRHMRARGVENHECIEAIRAELNSDYHGATVAELERWRTPTSPADHRKRTEAMRFVTELTLHGWLQMSNEVLGKAPTSAQVATKYATLAHGALGHEPEATGWTPSVAMTTKTRSFMKRWRRRWAVKYRKLPAGTTITDSEAGKKVLRQYGLVWILHVHLPVNSLPQNKTRGKKHRARPMFCPAAGSNLIPTPIPESKPNWGKKRAHKDVVPLFFQKWPQSSGTTNPSQKIDQKCSGPRRKYYMFLHRPASFSVGSIG